MNGCESATTDGVHPGTLVIPCFNEGRRLDVDALARFVRQQQDATLLFVNDGSGDDTAQVLDRLRAAHPEAIDCLTLAHNGGKAEAVRQGVLRAARTARRYVAYWDADLATPLDALPALVQALDSSPRLRLAMGSRVRLLGRQIARRTTRHLVGRAVGTVISILLGTPIYDTQCGCKVFRGDADTLAMFAQPFRTRWLFDVELLLRLRQLGRRTGGGDLESLAVEVPLHVWRDVEGSHLGWRHAGRILRELAIIRRLAREARTAAR